MKQLKRLIPYLKKHKRKIIIGLVFVTVSNLCSTYAPRIIGDAVDLIKRGAETEAADFQMSQIYAAIVKLALLTAGSALFMFLTRRTIILSSREIEYDLRKDLVNSIKEKPISFFHRRSSGSILAYSSNDAPAAREFMGPAVMFGSNAITVSALVLYFMININPEVTIISLLPLPAIAVIVYFLGKRIRFSFNKVQEGFANLSEFLQESYSGMQIIKAYGKEIQERKNFKKKNLDYFGKNMKLAKYQSVMMPSLLLMVGLSQVLVLGYGGYKAMNGEITLGELTQFFIYLNMLIWPFASIGWITNVVQRASASSERLHNIIDDSADEKEKQATELESFDFNGEIKFENVALEYEKNKKVFENLSFAIRAGKIVGVTGGIGTGKSSILNLITKLYRPSKGKIIIDGKELSEIPTEALRKNISVVTQDPFLFSTTIKENIAFGKLDAKETEIIEAAKKAALHDEIISFPEGYDSILGERGVSLSGGQKQRLALARALLTNSQLLILDDALSAVDSDTESEILSNLSRGRENKTIIVISHRISTLEIADKIIVIGDGKIIEQGTSKELIKKNGKFSKIYNLQKSAAEIDNLNK